MNMRRIAIALGAAVLALTFVALPARGAQTTIIAFDTWETTGTCPVGTCQFPYSTYVHPTTGPSGWMAPSFNDSAWLMGRTPFMGAEVDYCGVSATGGHSEFPIFGDTLVRVPLPLCAGVTNVQLKVKVDNSVAVWINGTALTPVGGASCEVGSSHSPEGILCDFEGCADDHMATYNVPVGDLHWDSTPNILAIQGCDHGVMSFLDFEVLADISKQVCDDPCEHVTVSADELWPPNHKFTPVSVTVGEGEDATLATITGVTQDEPLLPPGNKCPDAKISSDGETALLRVERLGGGDGRIYSLAYEVTIGPYECTGKVGVCVPHDQGMGPNCVDSRPPAYDSTKCPD